LTKGGDNADVLPETFQVLRSSPTGTVSCREPGADCRAGEDRDTGHALIGDIAQAMAAHESPRTTKLYDRTSDEITLDEVERITI
jgi:hypothetical protein